MTPRTKIIALEGAFHGRTMGALALTAKEAYRAPFEPLPGGVVHIPFGDVAALRAAMDETVAAVFLEPIQGEAGVRPLPAGYLQAAREATTKAGALLILDEVQTGIGRTGKWLASEDAGIVPDAMTLAKGLGGGFPIGALLTFGPRRSVAPDRRPARHAPSAATRWRPPPRWPPCTRSKASGSWTTSANVGEYLRAGLADVDGVTEVRGEGLLIGFDLDADVAPAVVTAGLEAGFIVNSPGPAHHPACPAADPHHGPGRHASSPRCRPSSRPQRTRSDPCSSSTGTPAPPATSSRTRTSARPSRPRSWTSPSG